MTLPCTSERVPPPVARRWAASMSSRARLPCWPGKNCICRNHTSAHPLADPYLTSASSTAPDPIVVLEGPGTVPASANGRGYAFLGLACRRTEARSMHRPDGAKGSHALARRSPLHDKIGRLSFTQRCNVTARSHVHLLHGESRPSGAALPSHSLGQQAQAIGRATRLPTRHPVGLGTRRTRPWMRCEGVGRVQQDATSADVLRVRLARHPRCPAASGAAPRTKQRLSAISKCLGQVGAQISLMVVMEPVPLSGSAQAAPPHDGSVQLRT